MDGFKTNLKRDIVDENSAISFLAELHDNNESYHPDDDAFDIVFTNSNPTRKQRKKLNKLMGKVNKLNIDPCKYLIDMENEKKWMTSIEDLMEYYKLSVSDMMLIASLDGLKSDEINDPKYMRDRIEHHHDLLVKRNPIIKAVNSIFKSEVKVSDLIVVFNADFYYFLDYCNSKNISNEKILDIVNDNPRVLIDDDDYDGWDRLMEIMGNNNE